MPAFFQGPAGLHLLLQRQLRRVGLSPQAAAQAHPSLPLLLERISRAYAESEQERYLMQRSQDIASREMNVLNNELQASQARLASLVSLSSDWLWEQDTELRFAYVSAHDHDGGADLAALLRGRRPVDELAALDEDEAQRYRSDVAAHRPFRNLRLTVPRTDGSPLFVRISGEPVFDGPVFKGYRGVGSDVTAATVAEQQVLQLARYDSLTGLPNRSMFMAQLDLARQRAASAGGGMALLFIDLDRFKHVNDTLGHDAGDELLKVTAKRLSSLLRSADTVARLGGDEFVIIIDDCADPSILSKVASRLLTLLCEPVRLAGRAVQVSGSVGIALYPTDGEDAASLMKNADTAMYQAKSRGKNNFQFFTAQLAERASRHFSLEGELRQALPQGELRLVYEPRRRIGDGSLCGIEALLRWAHPTRGLLLPADFMELAEESGLIVPMGRWLMEQACRQLRQWREQGLNPPRCSIRLSARQFSHEALLDELRAALSTEVLESPALQLEVAEASLSADPGRAREVLGRLHTLGVGIAIDDFGTGCSSLASLRHLSAQALKFGPGLVEGLPGDAADVAITQAVIALAHSLKMRAVAQGVQTGDQLALLRQLGCDEVQGPVLGPPLPPDALAALMAAQELALLSP